MMRCALRPLTFIIIFVSNRLFCPYSVPRLFSFVCLITRKMVYFSVIRLFLFFAWHLSVVPIYSLSGANALLG